MSESFASLFFREGIHPCEVDRMLHSYAGEFPGMSVHYANRHLDRFNLPLGDELVERMSGFFTWQLFVDGTDVLQIRFNKSDFEQFGL